MLDQVEILLWWLPSLVVKKCHVITIYCWYIQYIVYCWHTIYNILYIYLLLLKLVCTWNCANYIIKLSISGIQLCLLDYFHRVFIGHSWSATRFSSFYQLSKMDLPSLQVPSGHSDEIGTNKTLAAVTPRASYTKWLVCWCCQVC